MATKNVIARFTPSWLVPGPALAVVLIGTDPVLVTVTVSGCTVVPGTTDPSTVVAAIVVAGIVLASRIVPSPAGGAPSSLPGMAVPTPELVHCVGRSMVLILGLELSSL